MLIALHARLLNHTDSNDQFISLFRQEEFLKSVVKMSKNDKEFQTVMNEVSSVQQSLLSSIPQVGGFVQIASGQDSGKLSALESYFISEWKKEFSVLVKRKKLNIQNQDMRSPFPFPRKPCLLSERDVNFGNAVMVPISGLQTSYLNQIVECDVLGTEDHYPVVVLSELLSKTEGPLYAAIRGNGYAYGTSLDLFHWTGQLVFDLQDSSEPQRALVCFYEILEKLGTDTGFNEICSLFHLESAKACVSFRIMSQVATAGNVIFSSLRSSLRVSIQLIFISGI
jgi:Zn-dependent M16 (insulinase) family peptidase